jgi:hypothetical protein
MTTDEGRSASGLENHPSTIASAYFERRALSIGTDEIVVLACMRNEVGRLPYFLEYYRTLGVDRFLLVDNDSSDGTSAYLARQPDVTYFWTDASYRGSSAGRLWLQELADTYATGCWVITVDVDELLVYPGAEEMSLRELCAYLDDNDQEALFTVLLDMYSDLPLSQTTYEPGTDFVDTCPFFETDTYTLAPGANPPFMGVFGGPRDRLFRAEQQGRRPMMKKIPLVRWREGFSYIYSTHSHRFVHLSDVTGALLHFKFFASFRDVAAAEARRGDRRQLEHYRTYRETVEDDICFYGTQSRRYRMPSDLVRLGVMRSSSRYASFVAAQLRTTGGRTPRSSLLPDPVAAEGGLTLRSIAAIWPMVNNRSIPEYFGRVEPATSDRRLAFVEEMSRHIKVLDVRPDHVLVRLTETGLHRWWPGRLGMAIHVGNEPMRAVPVDGEVDGLEVDTGSLEPNVYRVSVDVAGAAERHGAGSPVAVAAYLYDMEAESASEERGWSVRPLRREDVLFYHQHWYPEGGRTVSESGLRGTVEQLAEGRLRGWVYDGEQDTFDLAVCVYIEGRLARHVWPTRRRQDIDQVRNAGSVARGRGFVVDLPFGYFDAGRMERIRVDVVTAGRNLRLRRSPLLLPPGIRDARWDDHASAWIFDGRVGAVNGVGHVPAEPWWKVWA